MFALSSFLICGLECLASIDMTFARYTSDTSDLRSSLDLMTVLRGVLVDEIY